MGGWGVLAIVDRLTRAVALYCGGVLLFVLMGIIVVDVTGRYVFNSPLYGSLDLSITFLVLIVASSIAYGGRTGAHVTADIFKTLLGPRFEWINGIFVKLFAAIITAVWCWRLMVTGRTAARREHAPPQHPVRADLLRARRRGRALFAGAVYGSLRTGANRRGPAAVR
jgi:TRAP-type C4-dicarboxylate transport system permease small subunit